MVFKAQGSHSKLPTYDKRVAKHETEKQQAWVGPGNRRDTTQGSSKLRDFTASSTRLQGFGLQPLAETFPTLVLVIPTDGDSGSGQSWSMSRATSLPKSRARPANDLGACDVLHGQGVWNGKALSLKHAASVPDASFKDVC